MRGLAGIGTGNEPQVSQPARMHAATAGVLLVVLTLAGCVTPAINAEGYRGKVSQSAKKMAGVVASAQLAAQLDLDGRMLQTLTDTIVTSAENDAQSVLTAFDGVQPPDEPSIALRDRADNVLQPASSQLSDLRIAVRRRDRANMRSSLHDLGKTLTQLNHLQAAT